MTIKECVDFVDDVKPNAFSDDAKVKWLGQIEGRIASEVLLLAPAELRQFAYKTMLEDGQKELLIDPPYDMVYTTYLTAKVDSKNGEFNKLSTAAQAFNRSWNELCAFFANRYSPADGYYGEYSTAGMEARSLRGTDTEGGEVEYGFMG